MSWACNSAGPPSTRSRTWATCGRTCSPTRCAAPCGGKPSRSGMSTNITDVGHAVADSDTGEDKARGPPPPGNAETVHRHRRDVHGRVLHRLAALNVLPRRHLPAGQRVRRGDDRVRRQARGTRLHLRTAVRPVLRHVQVPPGYGTLALLEPAGQRETGRVEHVEGRKLGSDFALWRAEEPGVRRVMRWNSPWGWGGARLAPGMLGDVDGAARRALRHAHARRHRSCTATRSQPSVSMHDDKPWVRYWLHNEFLLHDAADARLLRPPQGEVAAQACGPSTCSTRPVPSRGRPGRAGPGCRSRGTWTCRSTGRTAVRRCKPSSSSLTANAIISSTYSLAAGRCRRAAR